jgi:putative transposase
MQENTLALDPARPITMDGIAYLVEGWQGSTLALFNTLTGETLTMSYAAVMRRAVLPELSMDDAINLAAADAHLPELQKHKRDLRTPHVEEVAFGKPLDVDTYRPEYDPETSTQAERLDRKAAELAPLNIRGTSRSNLKKLVGKLFKQGPIGLADGRAVRIRDPFENLDPRLYSLMVAQVNAAKDKSTTTTQHLITETRVEWIGKYPGELDLLPGDRTLRRMFDILTDGRYTTGRARNRRSNEGAPKRYQSGRVAFAPGDEVQVDSTTLDVMVRGDNGVPFRPVLTTFIDKATHCITGSMVTDGVKGVDLAYLLARSVSIPELRPGPKLPFNLNELRRMPWAQVLIDKELEGKDTSRPIIVPSRIVMDNGKDYQSDVFLAACHYFCIDTTNAAPGTGTDKSIVERPHRTIKDLFVRHLPGFTGGDPGDRGYNIDEQTDLISIHTLAYVLDLWIRHIWNNLETDALRDKDHPGRRYSPNTKYEALCHRNGCLSRPVNDATYIALQPIKFRKLGASGIKITKRRYDSPALDPYRGKPSGNKLAGDQWRVHYDPDNPAAVWVHIPDLQCFLDTGSYIECRWMNAEAFEAPFERAVQEINVSLAHMGYQISKKFGHDRSRLMIKGAVAAAEKEVKDAEKRESRQGLAAEQGMGRPQPTTIVPPPDPANVWEEAAKTEAYGLFDPATVRARRPTRPSGPAAPHGVATQDCGTSNSDAVEHGSS